MENNEKYFNSPVQLYEGFLTDSHKCLENILNYALYKHSLELELGDEIECIESSAEYFNVSLGNPLKNYNEGQELHDSLPDNCPMTGINTSTYWQFRSEHKTEFEKVCLLGFLAFKSIIQDKAYCKVTNKYWLSRMDGSAKSKELTELSEPLKKYANEYRLGKIKDELKFNWNLIEYGRYVRGFYVSFKLTLEKLVYEVEKRKKSTKKRQLKEAENQARIKALNQLGITRP